MQHHPFWVGTQGDSVACRWIQRHRRGGEHKRGFIFGNPGVVSQMRGMIYGVQAGVRSEAGIQFCLLRSMPTEATEMLVFGCHESPVGQMPLIEGPEATSSDTDEH